MDDTNDIEIFGTPEQEAHREAYLAERLAELRRRLYTNPYAGVVMRRSTKEESDRDRKAHNATGVR